jgi:hypothetical protein
MMKIDPGRAIVGLATCYNTPCPNDGRVWTAEMFQDFLDLETAIPLRLNHGPAIVRNPRGSNHVVAYIGMVRLFASVVYPTPGLLILAEVDEGEFGDELLADLAALNDLRTLPHCFWGPSVGAHATEDMVVPYEVSVVHTPAFEDARILGVGTEAIERWSLLSPYQTVLDR